VAEEDLHQNLPSIQVVVADLPKILKAPEILEDTVGVEVVTLLEVLDPEVDLQALRYHRR